MQAVSTIAPCYACAAGCWLAEGLDVEIAGGDRPGWQQPASEGRGWWHHRRSPRDGARHAEQGSRRCLQSK